MDDFDYNIYNSQEPEKDDDNGSTPQAPGTDYTAPSFYTESYRKTKQRKGFSLTQLIIVSLVSSILGGGVVFGAFQFLLPALQPSAGSFFSSFIPGASSGTTTGTNNTDGAYKRIEIEKSDSPVTAIVEKVSPSIVGVKVTATVQDFFFGESVGGGEGSGIILREDGYILTNNHVIEAAASSSSSGGGRSSSKIEVILPNQMDKPYTATIVGRDSKTDLAVLKIEATGLPVAELGDSDQIKVGELSVAIGNPGGLEYMGSVTVGIISGLNRTVPIADEKELKLIQTDAAINPGNSGGALINSQGQVIGVNSIKFAAQDFEGMGFAIPINKVKEVTDSLIEFNYVKGRPSLGIYVNSSFNEEFAKRNNVPAGILVDDVVPLSGAYKAGIQKYDIITKFDSKAIKTFEELEAAKNEHQPGDNVAVEVYRDGETLKLTVELGEDKGQN